MPLYKKYAESRGEWMIGLSINDESLQGMFLDFAEELLDEPNTLYPLSRLMEQDALNSSSSSNDETFFEAMRQTRKTKLSLPSRAIAKVLIEIAELRLTHYNFYATISNMMVVAVPRSIDGGLVGSVERALGYIEEAAHRYSGGGQSSSQRGWKWIYESDALRLAKIFRSEIPDDELFADIGEPFGVTDTDSDKVTSKIFDSWNSQVTGRPTTRILLIQRHFVMVIIDPRDKTVHLVEGLDSSYLDSAEVFMKKYMPSEWTYTIKGTGIQEKVDDTPKSCGIFAAIFAVVYAMVGTVEADKQISRIKYDWEKLIGQLHFIVQTRKPRIPRRVEYTVDPSGVIVL